MCTDSHARQRDCLDRHHAAPARKGYLQVHQHAMIVAHIQGSCAQSRWVPRGVPVRETWASNRKAREAWWEVKEQAILEDTETDSYVGVAKAREMAVDDRVSSK